MAKRKKHEEHEEHENHERWLVSYADMMTLLMAFFVMLFAMSQIDLEKFKKFQGSVAAALNKPAPATPAGSGILTGGGKKSDSTAAAKSTVELADSQLKHDQAVKRERKDLLEAQKKIEGALQAKGLKQAVRFTLDARGLHVAIVSDKVLFDLGSADLRSDGKKVLDIVSHTIAGMPNMISVEGHTDNRPISGGRYPSNWELSTARASTVVRTIAGRYGIKPNRISASGYADQRPIKPNSTEAGRARNRRVEIVLISTVDQPVTETAAAVSPTPATDSETEEAPHHG
jgi:chemotaxis protein MotB